MISKRTLGIGLAITGLFLFFWNIGGLPFRDYDEALYAQVIKESAQEQRFLPLTLHGEAHFDKPPLYFWIATVIARTFTFSEGTARLPSALLGIGSILLTFFIAKELTGKQSIAYLASTILLLTPAFLEASRQVRLDVPVTFFILLGTYAYVRGWNNPRWYLLIGIAGALGFLSKSVVIGLLLPSIVILAIAYTQFSFLRSAYFWSGVLLGIGTLALWTLSEITRDGSQFLDIYVMSHLVNRVGKEVVGTGVTAWTYLHLLVRFVEPWILIFLVSIVGFCIQLARRGKIMLTENRLAITAGCITLIMFSVFALSATKLFYYLAPLYPFMALSLAGVGYQLYATAKDEITRKGTLFIGSFILLIGLISTIYIGFHIDDRMGIKELSKEEARLGNALRPLHHGDVPVYAINHLFWDTINFYGETVVTSPPQIWPPHFLLITPTYLLSQTKSTLQEAVSVPYQGPMLSLIEVRELRCVVECDEKENEQEYLP